MINSALNALLAGSSEERDLLSLYMTMTAELNPDQLVFHRAHEALTLLAIGGFEKLFEQDTSLEDYARALSDAGLPQLKAIFDRVSALVPLSLRNRDSEEALFDHLDTLFDDLKQLAYESYGASAGASRVLADYVRHHREQFGQ